MIKLDQIRETKLIELAKARFASDLKPAELKVLHDSASSEDPPEPDEMAPRSVVRADFLRWLTTDPEAAPHIDPKGLRVYAATIPSKLDLRECHVNPTLEFRRCVFQEVIDFCSAETRGLFFFDSTLAKGLAADRVIVHGPLFLRVIESEGEIRLLGARIEGNLDCTGAKMFVTPIANRSGTKILISQVALGADNAFIRGNVNLSGVESSRVIRLLGAKIKSDLSCSGAKLRVKEGNALYADSAEIGGNVFVNNGFESSGIIRLPGVKIKGDLSCSGAKLRVKEGNALYADGAEIGGSVLLNVFLNTDSGQHEDFESTGTIRLPGARIKGILSCSGAKLKVTMGDALFADCAEIGANVCLNKGFESSNVVRFLGTRIGGELEIIGAKATTIGCKDMRLSGDMWWMGIQEPREAVLDLTGATVKNLRDDRESWPAPGHLILDGLAYEGLNLHERPSQEQVMSNSHGLELPFNVNERVRWLMLQPSDRRTEPLPWMQLAKYLESKGDHKDAKHVIYKFRCLRAHAQKKLWLPRRWAIIFAWLEETPARILYFITATLLLGLLVFSNAGAKGAIAPTEPEAYKAFISGKPMPAAYPVLNPVVYTLENAVPIVKLGQDDKWAPDRRYPGTKWYTNYWFLMWSRWLLILSGWVQATVLVAALSGRFKP